jgi:hypothetical protein
MTLIDVLWYLAYALLALAVVFGCFLLVVSAALKRRQKDLEAKTGPLDLTGEAYRAHLRNLSKSTIYQFYANNLLQ